MKRNQWMIVGLVVSAIAYFALQFNAQQKKRLEGVHADNVKALGLSVAKEYLSSQLEFNKKAFHDYLYLKSYDLIAIHSPKFYVSDYEIEQLKTYVFEGGELFLTALSVDDYKRLNLSNLFKQQNSKQTELKTWIEAEKNEAFNNGEIKTLEWPEMNQVQHYSAIHWVKKTEFEKIKNSKDAEKKIAEKTEVYDPEYVVQWALGQGKVTVALGVPPYANTMLQFKENQDFLKMIKAKYPNVLWDVYHHYVKQAGVGDLFTDIQVVVPIAGFVVFVLLYFFMSAPRQVLSEHEDQFKERIPSYHDFYEGIYSSLFQHDQGREEADAYFYQKTQQLYGLKHSKLIKTGTMDEKEFLMRWSERVKNLAKHFKNK